MTVARKLDKYEHKSLTTTTTTTTTINTVGQRTVFFRKYEQDGEKK